MSTFSIMTWNVENLFLVGDESGPATKEIFEEKQVNLAATISTFGPDVVALQEIGRPAAAEDLQARLNGAYPHLLLANHPDPRHIRVGFLSKHPLQAVHELFKFPDAALSTIPGPESAPITRMGRGALKVTVEPKNNVQINLVTVHLKSKLVTYANGRRFPHDENERARGAGLALAKRAAEAVALRVFVNGLVAGNDRPLILLGDLNDEPNAVTTTLLLGPEDGSVQREDKGDDVRLYNLAEKITAERRYSRVYKKRKELIDHILATKDLFVRTRSIDSLVEPIEPIDESTEKRRSANFPDHAPVLARFDLDV